jgi:hypothetical protein
MKQNVESLDSRRWRSTSLKKLNQKKQLEQENRKRKKHKKNQEEKPVSVIFKIMLIAFIQVLCIETVSARYIQADPIGVSRDYSDPVMEVRKKLGMLGNQTMQSNGINHPYLYAKSNPLKNIDPFGLDVICGNNAVWIPPSNGQDGFCKPFREQTNQCASGDCAALPKSTNDSCVKKCIAMESYSSCAGEMDIKKLGLCMATVTTYCSTQTCDKCKEEYK